jgi:hypothetical protein
MLTLAPVACVLGAVGISGLLNAFCGHMKKSWSSFREAMAASREGSEGVATAVFPMALSCVVTAGVFFLTIFYAHHASFVASEAYSSPSIVLGASLLRVVMSQSSRVDVTLHLLAFASVSSELRVLLRGRVLMCVCTFMNVRVLLSLCLSR